MNHIEKLRALLLVGGLGTRLRPVLASTPKSLAPVGDRPFVELLLEQLRSQGITRIIMCTGYLADSFEAAFGRGSSHGVEIEYSREPRLLGTAGAVKFAHTYLRDIDEFLVLNGDSIVEVDFLRLIRFHQRSGGMATLVAIRSPNDKRFGTILSEANGRVIRFEEKAERGSGGLVNAGVYVFSRKILDLIPDGPTSLEKDVLPRILPLGVFALEQEGEFIDIGTPRDYARAQSMYERLKKAALRKSQTPSDEHSGDECN